MNVFFLVSDGIWFVCSFVCSFLVFYMFYWLIAHCPQMFSSISPLPPYPSLSLNFHQSLFISEIPMMVMMNFNSSNTVVTFIWLQKFLSKKKTRHSRASIFSLCDLSRTLSFPFKSRLQFKKWTSDDTVLSVSP